ncbi:RNase H domain-containing protein, partial [Aphis craccivora]
MSKLTTTLQSCSSKSSGPDNIPYNFLKNLPVLGTQTLLHIYVLESENHFTKEQCGFRRNHSTLDALLIIPTDICSFFKNNQHHITIPLDIKKAYDSVWKNRPTGSETESILRIYKYLFHSVISYGSIIYNSAKNNLLSTINPVHNQGIRLATGAFMTSPVDSILCNAAELPLDLRRHIIIGHENHKFSLPTSTSIYTEETYAIFKALKNDASSNSDSIVIIGDSLSALKTIITPYSKNELVQHIQELISTTNKAFTFMWVPSHVGISGNERADKFANEATLP